jgi:heme-degrading monooxygenase HmoA
MNSRYVIVWEFTVRRGAEERFAQVYGPDGVWAQFFRNGDGFIRTELRRNPADPGRFMTLDFWESEAAYEKFKNDRAAEYQRIDRDCENLTERETHLGSFNFGTRAED